MSETSPIAALLASPSALVAVIAVAYIVTPFLYAVLRTLRALVLPSNVIFKNYGQWAVVTGATDGIGKAYAEQLAEKGMDVVLISRSIDKLNAVARNIERTSKVNTKVIAADFTRGPEIYPDIAHQLSTLDVGVLVNNVGMAPVYPEYFHLVPNKKELYAAMINCNMLSVTEMTGIVLPQMLDKKKGIIINISSGSATTSVPLLSVYSATKNYVTALTKNLQIEYAPEGIVIQNVTPFFVATKMVSGLKKSFFIPEASDYVRSVLNSVGVLDNTFGCLSHWLQACIIHMLPVPLRNANALRRMLGARNAALRGATRVNKRD